MPCCQFTADFSRPFVDSSILLHPSNESHGTCSTQPIGIFLSVITCPDILMWFLDEIGPTRTTGLVRELRWVLLEHLLVLPVKQGSAQGHGTSRTGRRLFVARLFFVQVKSRVAALGPLLHAVCVSSPCCRVNMTTSLPFSSCGILPCATSTTRQACTREFFG